MKKILIALLFVVLPSLPIILTTSFSPISAHILHLIFTLSTGIFLAILYLFSAKKRTLDYKTVPLISFISLLTLLAFMAVHTMPCPAMMSSFGSQTALSHPCSQTTTPASSVISFITEISVYHSLHLSLPARVFALQVKNTENRAPPVS